MVVVEHLINEILQTVVVTPTLGASLDTVVSFKIYNHDLNDTNIIKHSLLSVQ